MRTTIKFGGMLVAICLLAGTAGAQTGGEAAGMPSAEDMQKMMDAMTPSPAHEQLQQMVGSWDYTMKMWMAPGVPPTDSSGTVESESMLGGRYVKSVFKGAFMGMPFEGHALDGYDNIAKKYTSVWVDNMSTWPTIASGSMSADGKVMSMSSESPDPVSGKTMKMRSVTTRTSADAWTMEMFMTDPASGQEFKGMELAATRKKS